MIHFWEKKMPKISDIENTPNPDARKFILKEPLTYGIIKSFDNKAEADKDELASEIFQISNVVSVFYVDNWITITQDGHADWKVLMRQIADIKRAPSAKDDQFKKNISWLENITNLTEIEKSKLEEISEILDEEIRPYLQGDGGDVHIVSLKIIY